MSEEATAIYKYPLKLPASLKETVKAMAKADGVSLNQWIVTAVAQKLGAVQSAESFFQERASQSDPGAISRYLEKSPDVPPIEGDELPDDLREKLS